MKELGSVVENGWRTVDFDFEYRYGYASMLKFFDNILEKDNFSLKRLAKAEIAGSPFVTVGLDALKQSPRPLEACLHETGGPLTEECGVLAIAGQSRFLDAPVQIVLFNQTSLLRLQSPEPEYQRAGEKKFSKYAIFLEQNGFSGA